MMPVEEPPRTHPRHRNAGRKDRSGSKGLSRVRIKSPLGLLWLVLLAGCATASITPTVRAPAGLPKPDRVLVHDFEVAPAEGALNYEIAPPIAQDKPEVARTEEEMRVGKATARILADSLVADLRGRGIDARRAGEAAPPEMNTLSIRGRFLWRDKDAATMRARIWFYQGGGVNSRLVAEADADIPSDSKRAAAVVGSGAYTAAQEADAKRMAKQLADRVAGYYREQGWISS